MKTKDFYNKISADYENLINSPGVDAKLLDKALEIFSKHGIVSGEILDVGCGPGNLKTFLGEGFNYTGIDLSDKMLEIAKSRGYKTIEGKIEEILPTMEDKSFDYVIAVSSLHFVEDIKFVLAQFERIARKGYLASLDVITEQYKQGFRTVCDDPVYDHSKTQIEGLAEDVTFPGWISPRGPETMYIRMVFKKL